MPQGVTIINLLIFLILVFHITKITFILHGFQRKESKCSIFTTSKTDCQLLRQKVRQRISVMKTNTGVFVVFKTKRELERQFNILET